MPRSRVLIGNIKRHDPYPMGGKPCELLRSSNPLPNKVTLKTHESGQDIHIVGFKEMHLVIPIGIA